MAKTFRDSKIKDFYSLIQIFLEQTNEKLKKPNTLSTDWQYLNGQIDAYKLILKNFKLIELSLPFLSNY
jgi:hypothetical protein